MTEEEQIGYVMRLAHTMSQAFLTAVGIDPGPDIDDVPDAQKDHMAEIALACRTSKGFRALMDNNAKDNYANNPEKLQGLQMILSARMGWIDLKMVLEPGGSA